jgi:hypothetical protein
MMIRKSHSLASSAPRARTSLLTWLVRGSVLMLLLSFGSCRYLLDEFTQLDRAGPIAEPQQPAPSATVDRA